MNRTTRAMATTALMLAVGAPLSAQGPQQGPRATQGRSLDRGAMPGVLLGAQIQAALRSQQTLGLDPAQVSALEAMRSELERLAETARLERESRRADRGVRPDSEEARLEQRRDLVDELRAERARTDTVVAEIQARFEATLPPLQRQELRRDLLQDQRDRMARAGRRGAREGARIRRGSEGVRTGLGDRGVRGRFPTQGERWGR